MVCLSCLVVRFSYNCLNHEKILFLFPLYLVHELPAALFYPFNILDFSLAHVQSWINRPASLSMGLKGLLSTLIPVLQYMCVHVLGFHCAEVLYANIISTLILLLLILQMSASSLGHWILCLDSLGALRLLKELYLGFLVYYWVSSGFTCLQFISLILFFLFELCLGVRGSQRLVWRLGHLTCPLGSHSLLVIISLLLCLSVRIALTPPNNFRFALAML